MGDLASIFVLSLSAMLNPTLLAAVTVMLLLPDPRRLMLGYLLGAYLTSISVGLLIVFSFHQSAGVDTARHTLTPAEDIVFGAIVLIVGLVLRSDLGEERRRAKGEEPKKESWPQRMLGRGSARISFAVGAAITVVMLRIPNATNRVRTISPIRRRMYSNMSGYRSSQTSSKRQ